VSGGEEKCKLQVFGVNPNSSGLIPGLPVRTRALAATHPPRSKAWDGVTSRVGKPEPGGGVSLISQG
jgi:hypothetical protein